MANDGTVKIGAEVDEKAFAESLSRIGKSVKGFEKLSVGVEIDKKQVDSEFLKIGREAKRTAPIEVPVKPDVDDFQKALADLEKEVAGNVSALKELDRALELNPQSTDLLVEKQKLLSSAVGTAAEKARLLGDALEKAKGSGAAEKDAAAYRKLVIELSNAEAEARDIQDALDDVTDELKRGEKAADGLSDATDDLGNSYSSVGDIIKGVAIGDLISNGIQAGISAIQNLILEIWNLDEATEEFRIAQGKLNSAFEAAGYGAEVADQAYLGFYEILGDTDTATEAAQLLATLAGHEQDIGVWTNIAAGAYATFGDALPINGLIEAANETARVGTVTGGLADALNWAGISEDEFNTKLAELGRESDRNQLIMYTRSETYKNAADVFYENNDAVIAARDQQVELDKSLAAVGESVAKVKTAFLEQFSPSIASAADEMAELISNIDPEAFITLLNILKAMLPVITGLTAGFLAYKAAMKVSAVIEVVTKSLSVLQGATTAQTVAQGALNAVTNANPFVLIARSLQQLSPQSYPSPWQVRISGPLW